LIIFEIRRNSTQSGRMGAMCDKWLIQDAAVILDEPTSSLGVAGNLPSQRQAEQTALGELPSAA
jgi:hypothetical protein